MNVYAFIPFIAVLAYIPLLVTIIMSRPWSGRHTLFVLYLGTAMIWSGLSFLVHSNFLMEQKLFLARLMACSFVWMAVHLYWFSRSFGYGNYVYGVVVGYLFLAGVIALAFLGHIPESIVVSNGVIMSMGNWFAAITIPLVFLMADNVVAQLRRLNRVTDQLQRSRITYILVGICIMAFFSVSNAFELLRRFPIDHFGNLACAIVWTYATVRYRIVDIQVIARRGLSWLGLIGVGVVVFLVLYFFANLVMRVQPDITVLVLAAVLAVLVGAVIYRVRDFFVRIVDRLFYRQSYQYRQKLLEFVRRRLTGVFGLEELGTELLPLFSRSLNCKRAFLLLPEVGSDDFVVKFSEPPHSDTSLTKIRWNSPVIDWLRRENKYLSVDSLEFLPEFRALWREEKLGLMAWDIELLFPFLSRGNLIAILALGRKNSGRYSLDDMNFVESITGQVAVSLEKEYLQEQLRTREQELFMVNRLTGIITSRLNIREVHDAFVMGLREVVDVDWAIINVVDGDELCVEALFSDVGSGWSVGERFPLAGTATEWVAKTKRPLVESDFSMKSKFWTGEEYQKRGIKSVACLPLIVKGEVIGALIIGSRQIDAYGQEHISLLEHLALQIAAPVENSRLHGRTEELARLDGLTGLFNRRHFDECLKEEIDRHSQYGDMLSLILLDLDSFKIYNDIHGHIAGDKVLAYIGQLIKESVRSSDLAFRYGGDEFAVILPKSSSSDAFRVAERVRGQVATEMANIDGGLTVSLGLATWPSDGATLDEICTAADTALYYAKRTGQNRTFIAAKMLTSLTGMSEVGEATEKEAFSVIYALAATIEARDEYTYGHSRKVSAYAVALAEAIDLPAERVAVINAASMLHDIGKVGIPDEVLNKVGKLEAGEWELIRSHPKLSATIVGHVSSLVSCVPAILHHHERWDGTGYPTGLKGGSIPIEARILAVADAFDAMISPRPYRGAMSVEKAIVELKRGSGTQFDPKLVEAFLPIASSRVPEELGIGESHSSSKVDS